MTLEATVVILDNTEYARNGDHLPSRYEAQTETIQAIISSKQQMNNENAIGLMTMGGPQVEVLTTPSNDAEAILGCLFGVKLRGDEAHFLKSLQIAQLALKHRKNKLMRQRVIVFVASPINEDEKNLERVAKQLKKNNLSVDIINLCQSGDNVQKLQAFVEIVNSGGSSHFLNAECGILSLNETLFNSPILNSFAEANSHAGGQSSSAAAAAATGGSASAAQGASRVPASSMANPFAEYGGIDPSEDPELAQVMKLSLEEEKRRLEQETNAAAVANPSAGGSSAQVPVVPPVQPVQGDVDNSVAQVDIQNSMVDENQGLLDEGDFEGMDDEEELLRQAILESQLKNPFEGAQSNPSAPQGAVVTEPADVKVTEEDKNLQTQADLMQDEDFVEDLLKLVNKDEKKDEEKK